MRTTSGRAMTPMASRCQRPGPRTTVLAGQADPEAHGAELQRLIRLLDLEDRVQVLGWVSEEQKANLLALRDLTGGTVAFGTFGSAHYYLLGGLVQDFRGRYPQVRVRVVEVRRAPRSTAS